MHEDRGAQDLGASIHSLKLSAKEIEGIRARNRVLEDELAMEKEGGEERVHQLAGENRRLLRECEVLRENITYLESDEDKNAELREMAARVIEVEESAGVLVAECEKLRVQVKGREGLGRLVDEAIEQFTVLNRGKDRMNDCMFRERAGRIHELFLGVVGEGGL